MLIAVKDNKFIVLFTIIFGTLKFPIVTRLLCAKPIQITITLTCLLTGAESDVYDCLVYRPYTFSLTELPSWQTVCIQFTQSLILSFLLRCTVHTKIWWEKFHLAQCAQLFGSKSAISNFKNRRVTYGLRPTRLVVCSDYTLWVKKTRHLTLAHNFTKYLPIFKILSLLYSVGN